MNEGKPDALPLFRTNSDVLDTYCGGQIDSESKTITCELYYELDWDYYLRQTWNCLDEQNDPCWGTHACLCDNDYYRFSAAMLAPTEDQQLKLLTDVWLPAILVPVVDPVDPAPEVPKDTVEEIP